MGFEGYLADGKTALRRPVRVALEVNRLQIFDDEGRPLDGWPFDGLTLSEEVYRRQPVRLTHRDRGDACLTLPGQEILKPLGRALPHLRRRYYRRRVTFRRLLLWVLTLSAVVVVLLIIVPYLAGPLARAVPQRWQEPLGAAVVADFEKKAPMCRAGAGVAALSALVERLGATMSPPNRFHVKVLKIPHTNAFAAPGGHIVLFQGLIASASSPEEVAGVLAHEMAHGVERHPMERLIRSIGFWVVLIALTGDVWSAQSLVVKFGETLLTLSYSREDEAEADRVGVEMLNRAGIRSSGLIDFFRRLQREGQDGPGGRVFLSTHPLHERRIAAIQALAREGREAMTEKEWQALKDICGGSGGGVWP